MEKILETKQFEFSRAQDDRIWMHSKKRKYGFWLLNSEMEKMFDGE